MYVHTCYCPCGVFKGDKSHNVREMKANGYRLSSKPMILSLSRSVCVCKCHGIFLLEMFAFPKWQQWKCIITHHTSEEY